MPCIPHSLPTPAFPYCKTNLSACATLPAASIYCKTPALCSLQDQPLGMHSPPLSVLQDANMPTCCLFPIYIARNNLYIHSCSSYDARCTALTSHIARLTPPTCLLPPFIYCKTSICACTSHPISHLYCKTNTIGMPAPTICMFQPVCSFTCMLQDEPLISISFPFLFCKVHAPALIHHSAWDAALMCLLVYWPHILHCRFS